jgi:amino acid adenylation domain-containing protein
MTRDIDCKDPSVSGATSPPQASPVHHEITPSINTKSSMDTQAEGMAKPMPGNRIGECGQVNLITDHARSSQSGYRPDTQVFPLGEDLSKHLISFSQRESLCPFSVLLAAFQALLSRYSGQTEFCVTCLDLNQEISERGDSSSRTSHLLKVFLDLSDNPSFLSLVKRQPQDLGEKASCGDGSLPSNVLFSFLKEDSAASLTRIESKTIESWIDSFQCDLALTAGRVGDEYQLCLTGNVNLFELETLRSFIGHFLVFLEAALENPAQDVATLPLLTPEERHQILVEWNSAVLPEASKECLHETFEAQVARTPNKVALVHRGSAVTYQELNVRANRLAHHLRELGAKPETLVAVCLGRSIDTVVALMAILKSGGAYLPLDPHYPQDRIAFMLKDAQAPILLTESQYLNSLPAHEARVVLMDRDSDSWRDRSELDPPPSAKRDNLAYVLYTSGSTGRPKGVALMHQSAVALVTWANTVYTSEEYSGVLFATSICFDLSVFEVFCPLSAGGKVILAQDALELANLPEANEVTLINTVPSVIAEAIRIKALPPSVRTINLAGEFSSQELVREIYASSHVQKVYDLYGATEDTTHSTLELRTPKEPPSVGRPFPSTQLYVLDSHLQPVPAGVAGEIFLGGAGLARGYLHRPELTAERFLENPFVVDPKARIYRTGDLGRFHRDGKLEYLGRIDHQVKIRGFRVELGEIETILNEHPSIEKSVVIAKKADSGDSRLLAYFVSASAMTPSVDSLRSFLSVKLPDYMVPSSFIPLDAFPRTPSGKIDRKSLPAPLNERPALEADYAAPRNDLEKYLSNLWSQILLIDQIGIHDRFFQLGGSSLQAARFINELQQLLGETIYIVTIFQSPTIAEYASFLLRDYPTSAAAHFPSLSTSSMNRSMDQRKIGEADIVAMKKAIPALPRGVPEMDSIEPKNPPVIFILAPPRSGTTLLRVMLAGHSNLFCPAELQLLGFNTLRERQNAFTGKYSLWLEGTLRALMEIHGCDADQAKMIMENYEAKDYTTKQFYRVLQDSINGRILVDKSPSYASDLDTLHKAERDFDGASYIHLSRHPYAMSRSFANYHMDQVLYLHEHNFSPLQLAELIWTISHRNILDFLSQIPEDRQFHIRYEDLVTNPEAILRQMCTTLNLEFQPGLLNPYQNIETKMTDGIYSDSTPMGDTHLFKHQGINSKLADNWKGVIVDDFLGEPTWEVAALLGYERSIERSPSSSTNTMEDSSDSRIDRRNNNRQRREQRLSLRENRDTR